ncbi:MAG: hypothetical protein COZ70_09365 [Deltaproteobacteria bacterium CG_4_8_14_3_um_filter_51_11]|nr:MBL fold metallo-hydrolase [bacterium]OIP38932.1 MAG: hypothetical protein AUK25_11670 [Desulfobacteraceae bacterium CG2_30_51_40]PIP45497.1 MAG: hypothetical protein COX16_12955 [Deltaproteobacteria bacterium CG23_combo_of_CG06-09_8_20_14_all_51_20]PIX19356.1 MAG: hypothetical protein COZ70_09365 [Deltaproteobacteria bacterium CG_4_8_14_3_um_filter_51_11]PJB37149.1 MAG: hypothetical protein CO107_05710 [Deltaproteobacteria bacterium CG_4_9_14_3_um_filter_51_14]
MIQTAKKIYTSDDGSIVAEKDFLTVVDPGCEERTVNDFVSLSRLKRIPVKYAFLTHSHWDHVHNIGKLKKVFKDIVLIGHKNNPRAKLPILRTRKFHLGETTYVLITTPGHCEKKDDICVYLPAESVLFSGDTVQPQGESFEHCNFCTPVPYFEYGDLYLSSLIKIAKLDIKHVITGHGAVLSKDSIAITLKSVKEIAKLSREVVSEADRDGMRRNDKTLAQIVFRSISEKRHFRQVEERLKDPYYDNLDSKGIIYFINKYRNHGKKDE